MIISVSKLKQGDLLETMRFAFCADKQHFIEAFNSIGIPINSEADLKNLVKWHSEKQDVSGIKLQNGQIINLDIVDFVKKINIRHSQLLKCSISFIS